MINGHKILGLILARGQSKRLPRKNLLPLGGKPLIAWVIEAANRSRYIDRTVLSSDDEEIIETARRYGCEAPFVRPKEFSTDETDSLTAAMHALDTLEEDFEYLVLIQPTSPFVQSNDIDGCIELCLARNAHTCVTVSKAHKSPYWIYTIGQGDKLNAVIGDIDKRPLQSQEMPTYHELNGAVFIAKVDWLRNNRDFVGQGTVAYRMESNRSIDIDTKWDLTLAEMILKTGIMEQKK